MRTRRKDRGFSLLEIILAMGVLMVASLGALALFQIAVDSHQNAEDQTTAALAAEGLIADYQHFCTHKALQQYEADSGESILSEKSYELLDQQCANYPQFYYDLTLRPPNTDPEITIGQATELLATLRLKHFPEDGLDDEQKDARAYTFNTVFLLKPF